MQYACLLQYVVKKVSTFSSLNKVSNKILRVIFLLSILWNRSDVFFLSVWTLLVKREVLQNSSEQTPDLGVDQNSNLPCCYRATFIGCYEVAKETGSNSCSQNSPIVKSHRPHQHGPVPSHVPCIVCWLEAPDLLTWLGTGLEHLLKSLKITVDKMT